MARLKRFVKLIIIFIYRMIGSSGLVKRIWNRIAPLRIKRAASMTILEYKQKKTDIPSETKDRPVIYFDISGYAYTKVFTGIQRVVKNFMEYLPEICSDRWDVKYIVGFDSYVQVAYTEGRWTEIARIEPSAGDVFLVVDLTAEQQLAHKKQLLSWQKAGCLLIACVHDLTFLKYPQYISSASSRRILSEWFHFLTHHYDGILSVSDTVKKEIIQAVKKDKKAKKDICYGYFHNGTDFSSAAHEKKREKNTVFIAVSTIEPRKGYDDLIEAFEKADPSEHGMKLVIVGREGWKCGATVQKIKSSPLYGDRILWYSDCDDAQLKQLYQTSDFLVSASYYEGFGIGLIEAASFGLPLLIRDIPVYREIAGERAVYFTDTADLKEKLIYCCEHRTALNGQVISYLSWKDSVRMAYSAVENVRFSVENDNNQIIERK